MKRRLLQFLFALGLLLTVAAACYSVRSFWVLEAARVAWQWADGDWRTYAYADLSANCGQVRLLLRHHRRTYAETQVDGDNFQPTGFAAFHFSGAADPSNVRRPDADAGPWERLGFRYRRHYGSILGPRPPDRMNDWEFSVPGWFAALACAALTFVPYRALRRDARRRARIAGGQCAACGYDLRGADHVRCPECGASVESAAPARV